MTKAIDDVIAERRRQIDVEGWTEQHDDDHDAGTLACAGAAYALNAGCVLYPLNGTPLEEPPFFWMWERQWWKPRSPRMDLIRAAALIIAEIDKLDRHLSYRTPQWIFTELVEIMGADNGCQFHPSTIDIDEAVPAIEALQRAGYFADETDDLDHSFWQAVAGEETEAKNFFSRAPEAYAQLSTVLNRVFEP